VSRSLAVLSGILRNFSRLLVRFLAGNQNLVVFLAGFILFGWAVSRYSTTVSGAACGVILMGIAVRPFLLARQR
jgi:hypothetical protein